MWRASSGELLGSGVTVAVLDSGIKSDRPDFLSASNPSVNRVVKKVAIAQDAMGGPGDDNGHGTYVSGIIAGSGWGNLSASGDDSNYIGIAPDANIVSIKVSDRYGRARTSDVIAGIEWAVANKDAYGIQVLNLSLVSAVAESYKTSQLDAAVELAWLKGLVVVVSAGNTGPDTVFYPPANDPYVIVVGATDDGGTRGVSDDTVATFSSYGVTQDGFAKPDVVAPGRRIVSTLSSKQDPLAQQFPDRITDNGWYIRLSGTSAAAPQVSGATALILQTYRLLQQYGYAPAGVPLTPDQLKWLLQHTSRTVAGDGAGAGYPSVYDLLSYLVDVYYYHTAVLGTANEGLVPNNHIAAACASTPTCSATWGNVSWDNVSWDNVSWDNVSWDNVSWDNVSWDNVSWDTVALD